MQIKSVPSANPRQSTAVEMRCPHGSSFGSCSACNGLGGGGGGGSAKRSTSGLMSWNQAWALWNSLQMAKVRQADYLKGITFKQSQMQNDAVSQLQRQAIQAAFSRFSQATQSFRTTFVQVMSLPTRVLSQAFQELSKPIRTLFLNPAGNNPNSSVLEKVASLLGDVQKQLEDILHHNLEVLKHWIAKGQLIERLVQIQQLMDKAMQAIAEEWTQWLESSYEQLQRGWKALKHWFQQGAKSNRNQKEHAKKSLE